MLVKEIMTDNPACCTPETNLQEVARLMLDNDCGAIPVIENKNNKRPIGVITDRDITVRAVAKGDNPLDLTVDAVMTKGIVTVKGDASIEECVRLMEDNQVRRIPVVDNNGGCIGMVAQADIAVKTENKAENMVEEVSKASANN